MPPFSPAPTTPTTPTDFASFVDMLLSLINIIIPVVFAVVFMVVIWKVIDAWVINGGDSAKREEGKRFVVIAVLVFVLMIVAWGVVALIRAALLG